MLSVKADVLRYGTKRKGYRRKEAALSHSSKTRFIQGGFFYLRIHIAEHRKKSAVGLSAWGAVLYFSPNRGYVCILIHRPT